MKRDKLLLILVLLPYWVQSQEVVGLEQCRELALAHNKSYQISAKNVEIAKALSKAAFANFFPKFSAFANYNYNQKNISLLAEDAHLPIGVIGTDGTFGTGITPTSAPTMNSDGTFSFAQSAINNKFVMVNGKPVPLDKTGKPFDPKLHPENILWKNYALLPKESMEFEMTNIFVGGINFVQPIFMGGKIVEMNKIAQCNEKIAQTRQQMKGEELIVSVDEAYWRVVSLENKVKLAKEYHQVLAQLDSNVTALFQEGMTTKAECLKIRVKLNDAEATLDKAQNGLNLSLMALNQLCGVPLDRKTRLEDTDLLSKDVISTSLPSVDEALGRRPEMKLLGFATEIADAKRNLMLSRFLPNIALTGSYLISNPNAYHGFAHKTDGMFTFGVTATIPLFHFGKKYHSYQASKVGQEIAKIHIEEAKEKITLQINQSSYLIQESIKKRENAQKNIESAEENMRYAKEGFAEGVITSSDLMMAQTAWLKAKSDYIDAVIDVKLNNIYLKKAIGTLSKNRVENKNR